MEEEPFLGLERGTLPESTRTAIVSVKSDEKGLISSC